MTQAKVSGDISGKIASSDWDDAVQSDNLPLTGTQDERITIDQSGGTITIYVEGAAVMEISKSEIKTTLPINQVASI